jgi:hypothetical protein
MAWKNQTLRSFLKKPATFLRKISIGHTKKDALSSKTPELGPYNFSFSGCGFLMSYHLGVAHGLLEVGALDKTSKVAGASGGAIAALAIASEMDMHEIQADVVEMARLSRSEGTIWKLEPRVRELLHKRMANVSLEHIENRLTVTAQKVWPSMKIVHYEQFFSKEDLVDAIIASCFIPMYLGPHLMTRFRNELHFDGGLIKIVPEIPGYIKVCAFHADMMRRPDYEISPSLHDIFPYNIFELGRFALFPPQEFILDKIFQLGQNSAKIWTKRKKNAIEKK